jgi:hypothetical protein
MRFSNARKPDYYSQWWPPDRAPFSLCAVAISFHQPLWLCEGKNIRPFWGRDSSSTPLGMRHSHS